MTSQDVQTMLLAQRSVEDRLRISAELRDAAWTLRRSVIRRQHPEWTHLQLEDAVRAAFASVK
jgi:hypothetical protein